PAFKGAREQLEIALFTNLVPGIGGEIQGHLTGFLDNAGQLGTVGVVGLGLSALLLLSTIEATFNRIWRVERPRPLIVRFLLYWGALTLGPLLIGAGITLTTDAFSVARQGLSQAGMDASQFSMEAGGVGDQLWSILLQTLLFTFLFVVIPNRRVRWRNALVGGGVSAVGFQILKIGFAWYLGNVFTYQAIYGAMAAFPIFLIWLYLSWCVMLLGATFAASVPEWKQSTGGLGIAIGPGATLATAIRVLATLKRASRDGDEVTGERLGNIVGTASLDPIIAAMLEHAYIRATDTGGLILGRDLEIATVADLHASLGLAALPGDVTVSGVVSDTAIQGVIQGLATAEHAALDTPLANIVAKVGETKQ
ncbi:MAG: YihY family inner membrane protein, partial [Alphaproteobacteria bacterium]|nr:YihY family inner membrane protein [Alphaproteobacteria bacterium]